MEQQASTHYPYSFWFRHSIGVWVNAVDNNTFLGGTVSSPIWYDNIKAVTSDTYYLQ